MDRVTQDLDRLVKWIGDPQNDGLLSHTERIMVAIAAEDQTRAPGSLKEADNWMGTGWADLDHHQQEVVLRYQEQALGAYWPVDHGRDAELLVRDIKEKIGILSMLNIPEEDRQRYMETVLKVAEVHYLAETIKTKDDAE